MAVAFLLALLPASLALLALVGLGATHGGSPLAIGAGAVALTFLPALGLSGFLRNRPLAVAIALLFWTTSLLAGTRLYFPGERAEAVATGLTWLGGSRGEPSSIAKGLGSAVDFVLLGDAAKPAAPLPVSIPLNTRPPDPAVRPVPVVVAPPAPGTTGATPEDVALEYQGEGQSLRIPVLFEGPAGEVAIPWMIFDTGATFTTLDTATLEKLGVPIPPDAPVVTMLAATGPHQARLVLLRSVQLGGKTIPGVTVAVCDSCAAGGATGLLGLNVSGQFQVTLDPAERRMHLRPRTDAPDRKLDVEAWVTPAATLRSHEDGRFEAEITVTNAAARSVDEVVVEIQCPDQVHEVKLSAIPEKGRGQKTVAFPEKTDCARSTIRVSRGSW